MTTNVGRLGTAFLPQVSTGGNAPVLIKSAQELTGMEVGAVDAELTAGPWRLRFSQFSRGADAAAQIQSASAQNVGPLAGVDYLLIYVAATNAGTTVEAIDFDDFAFFGSHGIVRRSLGLIPPAPALQASLEPGQQTEGWVAGAIDSDDASPFMIFDSRSLTGKWSDRLVRLAGNGSLTPLPEPVAQVNETGGAPDSPAVAGEVVATTEWVIELMQAALGQEVYDLSDFRTQAVGDAEPGLIPSWLALRWRITSNRPGLEMTHLPATAFSLAFADGSAVLDVPRLTPPAPDASGDYISGGSRDGWVAFEIPGSYDGSLIRFQPYWTDQDVRFLTWGDGAAPAGSVPDEPTPAPPDEQIPPGSAVIVTEDDVNLRAEATTEADIIAVLESDTSLQVTGDPVEDGGLLWYPVENEATGDQGFIAANFIRPES